MRRDSLLTPGELTNAVVLLNECCKAISQVEIQAGFTPGGKTTKANKLQAFFTDCASKLAAYVDTVLPTVTTRVRTATDTATITFAEALSPSKSVPLTSVVFSPARVVTAINVTGSTMVITATGVIATDTVTYTPPTGKSADQGVKDQAGNLAATFTGVLA